MQKKNELDKISEVISRYNLKPKKSLSQNFLLDLNLTERIVNSMGQINNHDILEIGPGPGALTRSLLDLGARKVIAIEKDSQFLDPLNEISKAYPGKLKIINADVLSIDIETFLNPPVKIVSNLPYNVGTQILLNFISKKEWPPFWESLTLMFQKEVADRLISEPKNKSYGRLSILAQWRSNVKMVFKVNASSFLPVPKVHSAVVQFTPSFKPQFFAHQETLERIVKDSFNQRRKMLRQSLKKTHFNIEKILTKAEIDPSCRPEELSIKQFCKLANILTAEPN
ncbi:MAG: 16S rRNA (adenine(1518)-N(6)/adenine(1519)-N(6))-dimethyltransferase RsmA [Paracoccaceae bacterium]|nr:16S rRNA (adenine(1518)-N(6)/adenine(1519)-N(6))-dimethyltransferase RsmA [Paracoccaceae bacterium]